MQVLGFLVVWGIRVFTCEDFLKLLPSLTPRRRAALEHHGAGLMSKMAPLAPPANAPLVCHGHSRPIVNLEYSQVTDDGVFLISSSKGASGRFVSFKRCLSANPATRSDEPLRAPLLGLDARRPRGPAP